MLDVKFIRENWEVVREALNKRKAKFDLDGFIKLDERRRGLIKEIDNLRCMQNKINQKVKVLLKEKKKPFQEIEQMRGISQKIAQLEEEFKEVKREFHQQLLNIPNLPHPSLPCGDASCNKIVRERGGEKKLDFSPLTHIELGEHLEIIDFKRAAKICGSNFVVFKEKGARLVRALINFMLDLHTQQHRYKEVFPPFLVNRVSLTTTGQLPKLEDDMYRLKDDDYFLIPTAEVPITNLHYNEILGEEELPLYYVSYTACFRREAGSYGKETKGLMRVHQFDKVELVKFVHPQNSYQELETLLDDACRVVELLNLPYRVVLLSTEELSFAASKCYDIEVYAPGVKRWLEISSCSNFEDFQARRGNIRYREKATKQLRFVHTLNGSGVALPRLIAAILENNQQKDGSIVVPEVLRKYVDAERIEK